MKVLCFGPIILLLATVTLLSAQGVWTSYTTSNSGLVNDCVYAIGIDPAGHKWFATAHGVSEFDGTNWNSYISQFPNPVVLCLAFDNAGNKWFGTNGGGVVKFDGVNWTVYDTTNSGLISNVVTALSTQGGIIWCGTHNGASKFDGSSWTNYTTADGLASNIINAITIESSTGYVWFGTDSGISVFDGTSFTTYNTTNSPLPHNNVRDIAIDNLGNKWIATYGGGVARFDGTNWTIYNTFNSGLARNAVVSLAILQDNFWFSTWEAGVCKLIGTNWINYNTSNSGLISNTIYDITVEARTLCKWFASRAGVSRLCGDPLGIKNQALKPLLFDFQLYPNPFNTELSIRYSVPYNMDVKISIYNLYGENITELFNGFCSPGEYTLSWNASRYASGLYFVCINAGSGRIIRQALLMK